MRLLDESLLSKISDYITKYQVANGESPSQRKIAAKLKLDHKKTYRYVHALASRELIDLNDDGTIKVPYQFDSSKQRMVPLVGAVRCGEPTLTIEDYDGIFKLPREFTGSGKFFMLKAKGDSMINAGINEGDYLVVREQDTAENGDIVVACKLSDIGAGNSDATLKRYKYKDGKHIMHPENEKYEDMEAKDFKIIGKLVSFIRKV